MSMLVLYAMLILFSLQIHTSLAGQHQCVHAARKLAKNGNGSTETSCMMCDPTFARCPTGCQAHVDKLYRNCQGVCMPDGYFFDPTWKYAGCWNDWVQEIKIGVERCGCDSAATLKISYALYLFVFLISVYVML